MATSHSILVADGKTRTVPDLKATLGPLGCDVIAVGDAHFVLTMAIRHKPSMVVLGAALPAGGSLTALRRLRSSVHTASIPVVALAGPGAQKQALLSAGAEECLEPPVSEADVLPLVERYLGISRAVTTAPDSVLADPDRLDALRATGLLDTEPDEALDIITRLAAGVLSVPVALVSLVDDTRQFFKSQLGLPSPWSESRQTPLSHSFCQWVVSSQEELVVGDARNHPVLRTNGAVADLGVIAYAGVPLSAALGQPIGAFCAVDGKPREWTEDELASLRDFAQVADAHNVMARSLATGPQPGSRELHVRAVTRAAGRGFLGAARLLQRNRPQFDEAQRAELLAVVARHSHQLIELADQAPAA